MRFIFSIRISSSNTSICHGCGDDLISFRLGQQLWWSTFLKYENSVIFIKLTHLPPSFLLIVAVMNAAYSTTQIPPAGPRQGSPGCWECWLLTAHSWFQCLDVTHWKDSTGPQHHCPWKSRVIFAGVVLSFLACSVGLFSFHPCATVALA